MLLETEPLKVQSKTEWKVQEVSAHFPPSHIPLPHCLPAQLEWDICRCREPTALQYFCPQFLTHLTFTPASTHCIHMHNSQYPT